MPPDIEQVLDQLREVLLRWHREDTLGEVAIVRGYHQYVVEERPKRKHEAVKRTAEGGSVLKLSVRSSTAEREGDPLGHTSRRK